MKGEKREEGKEEGRSVVLTPYYNLDATPTLGSAILATPPSFLMSAGTFSNDMTAQAPASSAILACSALTTSIMIPPLSIWASPSFTTTVPMCMGVEEGGWEGGEGEREGRRRARGRGGGGREGGEEDGEREGRRREIGKGGGWREGGKED